MKSLPFISPKKIVAILYDGATDDHVFVRANGEEERRPHSPEVDKLASDYICWFTLANRDGLL